MIILKIIVIVKFNKLYLLSNFYISQYFILFLSPFLAAYRPLSPSCGRLFGLGNCERVLAYNLPMPDFCP
jgi:hypothetical protein